MYICLIPIIKRYSYIHSIDVLRVRDTGLDSIAAPVTRSIFKGQAVLFLFHVRDTDRELGHVACPCPSQSAGWSSVPLTVPPTNDLRSKTNTNKQKALIEHF